MPIGMKYPGTAGARLTAEGGFAIKVINDTGGASVKGYIVEASAAVDGAVDLVTGDDIDPLGIIYEAGVPLGDLMWVVVSGITAVYYGGNVTRGTFSRVPTAGEALPAGQALNEALPTAPFATDKHFQEIGHPIESRVGAGLALTILHFN